MMFASPTNGLSHCREEDAPDLEVTIDASLRLVAKTVAAAAADERLPGVMVWP